MSIFYLLTIHSGEITGYFLAALVGVIGFVMDFWKRLRPLRIWQLLALGFGLGVASFPVATIRSLLWNLGLSVLCTQPWPLVCVVVTIVIALVVTGLLGHWMPGRYIARWDIETSSWSFMRITEPLLAAGANLPRPPSFIGVDSESRMYFWEVIYDNNIETTTITKSDAEGNIIWRVSNEMLGSNPAIPNIQPDGTLIIINGRSFSGYTTIGTEINIITIPDPTHTPTVTPIYAPTE